MQFDSIQFIIFFVVLTTIYFLTPQKIKWMVLLLGSLLFYMAWVPKYIVVLAASAGIAYFTGRLLERFEKRQKRAILWGAVVLIAGILFLFKYTTFAIYLGNVILSRLHRNSVSNPFSFLLPIGISFYTLQMLSYVVDVYRGKTEAEKNPFRFALYASFFPIVLSGPFVRYSNFKKQTEQLHIFKCRRVLNGIFLILWGLFEKMVVADRLYVTVNHVFHNYETYKGFSSAIAAILFTIELYVDFSGYIDIATGAAQVLGYRLPLNFNKPFMAVSVADFFRRWHVTFYEYIKEYAYLPLRGNKNKPMFHLLLVGVLFLLSGLWHGASMHFLIWGLVNALFYLFGKWTKPWRKKLYEDIFHVNTQEASYRFGQRVVTFICITISFVFFRADGVSEAVGFLQSIVYVWNPWIFFDGSLAGMGLGAKDVVIAVTGISLFLILEMLRGRYALRDWLAKQNVYFQFAVTVMGIGVILVFYCAGGSDSTVPFYYFQF